jgi:hypothetical protein
LSAKLPDTLSKATYGIGVVYLDEMGKGCEGAGISKGIGYKAAGGSYALDHTDLSVSSWVIRYPQIHNDITGREGIIHILLSLA